MAAFGDDTNSASRRLFQGFCPVLGFAVLVAAPQRISHVGLFILAYVTIALVVWMKTTILG